MNENKRIKSEWVDVSELNVGDTFGYIATGGQLCTDMKHSVKDMRGYPSRVMRLTVVDIREDEAYIGEIEDGVIKHLIFEGEHYYGEMREKSLIGYDNPTTMKSTLPQEEGPSERTGEADIAAHVDEMHRKVVLVRGDDSHIVDIDTLWYLLESRTERVINNMNEIGGGKEPEMECVALVDIPNRTILYDEPTMIPVYIKGSNQDYRPYLNISTDKRVEEVMSYWDKIVIDKAYIKRTQEGNFFVLLREPRADETPLSYGTSGKDEKSDVFWEEKVQVLNEFVGGMNIRCKNGREYVCKWDNRPSMDVQDSVRLSNNTPFDHTIYLYPGNSGPPTLVLRDGFNFKIGDVTLSFKELSDILDRHKYGDMDVATARELVEKGRRDLIEKADNIPSEWKKLTAEQKLRKKCLQLAVYHIEKSAGIVTAQEFYDYIMGYDKTDAGNPASTSLLWSRLEDYEDYMVIEDSNKAYEKFYEGSTRVSKEEHFEIFKTAVKSLTEYLIKHLSNEQD